LRRLGEIYKLIEVDVSNDFCAGTAAAQQELRSTTSNRGGRASGLADFSNVSV